MDKFKLLSVGAVCLTGANFGNAVYAYLSGPYGKRKGYFGPEANAAVVWGNSTFSLGAALWLFKKAFFRR